MTRRTALAAIAFSILAARILTTGMQAQTGVESNVPEAGFGPPTPTIQVYSRETVVDVLVTGADGQPVRGLTRSDFTIEEDGHPQPIRGFYEYDKAAPPAPAHTLPPNTYTNATTLPVSGPVQVFLFDALGSPPACLVGASKYIEDYLRSMPAGTQVALFALSPSKGLVLMQGFSADGNAAADIVDKLNVEWIRNPVYRPKPIAIAGMNQIAAYVAGIHGRKNLVWIVPGMPLMITRDGGYGHAAAAGPDMTIVHDLMNLYDVFTREQIAIYPLNPCGVHLPVGDDQEVADATGGTTDNTNDFKGEAAKIVDQSSHMYTLSYVTPRSDEDHHYHPIKITVDRPGLRLVYRNGYNDEQPSPPDPALRHDMIQGPMRLGALPSTEILFDLQVQRDPSPSPSKPPASPVSSPAPHTKGIPYNAVFLFDPTEIALSQLPDGARTGSIELDLGAYDSFSQLVAVRSQTFKITVTPAQYAAFMQRPLKFSLPIDLPHGQLTLHAGLFDTVGNQAGTLEATLAIPRK